MKHIENTNIYKANKGCFIVRISDGFIMGEDIDLGTADNINNYRDEQYTESSYVEFYNRLGMEVPNHEEEDLP